MEIKSPERKVKQSLYLSPRLHRWLWLRRAETGKSVSEIGEELMTRQIEQDKVPLEETMS